MADKGTKKHEKDGVKKAVCITGHSQFALLAWCTLCPTLTEAKEQKTFIDEIGCGGGCSKNMRLLT